MSLRMLHTQLLQQPCFHRVLLVKHEVEGRLFACAPLLSFPVLLEPAM